MRRRSLFSDFRIAIVGTRCQVCHREATPAEPVTEVGGTATHRLCADHFRPTHGIDVPGCRACALSSADELPFV